VRTHPLFEQAPHVQQVAAGLGAATLLATGAIALVQTDIKRVIAYSTMSQIGYMFLAAVSALQRGDVPLVTHAFFKALLFLGAASSSTRSRRAGHAQDGRTAQTDARTFIAMLIAPALAGLPPLAGFFSKDAILAAAFSGGIYGKVLFARRSPVCS